MFKRYRNYGPPLVAALFIFVALYAASQTGEQGGNTNGSQDYSAGTNQKSSPVLPPPVVGFLPPVNSVEARYDPEKTGEYDLTAQRWMAWFTGIIALLTGSGVLLIWGTLRETGLVLHEARETTKAAVDAAAAAWKTEKTTRDMGQAQSRAYVHAPAARIVSRSTGNALAPPSFYAFLKVKNEGTTLAKKVEIFYKFALAYPDYDRVIWPLDKPRRVYIPNIAGGQAPEWTLGPPLNTLRDIMNKENAKSVTALGAKLHLRVWGEVRYSDIHHCRFKSAFQFETAFPSIEESNLLGSSVHLPVFEEIEDKEDKKD